MDIRKEKINLSGQINAMMKRLGMRKSDMKKMVNLSQPTIQRITEGSDAVKFENYYEVLNALNNYGVKP